MRREKKYITLMIENTPTLIESVPMQTHKYTLKFPEEFKIKELIVKSYDDIKKHNFLEVEVISYPYNEILNLKEENELIEKLKKICNIKKLTLGLTYTTGYIDEALELKDCSVSELNFNDSSFGCNEVEIKFTITIQPKRVKLK